MVWLLILRPYYKKIQFPLHKFSIALVLKKFAFVAAQ